jgi:hypothetical protein
MRHPNAKAVPTRFPRKTWRSRLFVCRFCQVARLETFEFLHFLRQWRRRDGPRRAGCESAFERDEPLLERAYRRAILI